MKKARIVPRILALLLSGSLALPAPTFALRPNEAAQSGVEDELSEELGRPSSKISPAGAEETIPAGDKEPRRYDAKVTLRVQFGKQRAVRVKALEDGRLQAVADHSTQYLLDDELQATANGGQEISMGWLGFQLPEPRLVIPPAAGVSRFHATVKRVDQDGIPKIQVVNQSGNFPVVVQEIPSLKKMEEELSSLREVAFYRIRSLGEEELQASIRRLMVFEQGLGLLLESVIDPDAEKMEDLLKEVIIVRKLFEGQLNFLNLSMLLPDEIRTVAVVAALVLGYPKPMALDTLRGDPPKITPGMAQAYLARGDSFHTSVLWKELIASYQAADLQSVYAGLNNAARKQAQIQVLAKRVQREIPAPINAGAEEQVKAWLQSPRPFLPGLLKDFQVRELLKPLEQPGANWVEGDVNGVPAMIGLQRIAWPKVLQASPLPKRFRLYVQLGVIPKEWILVLQEGLGVPMEVLPDQLAEERRQEILLQIQRPGAEQPQQPESLLLLNRVTFEQFDSDLADAKPSEVPAVIVGVREGALARAEFSAVLSYWLDLLSRAADVGLVMDRLEDSFSIESEKATWLLRSSA